MRIEVKEAEVHVVLSLTPLEAQFMVKAIEEHNKDDDDEDECDCKQERCYTCQGFYRKSFLQFKNKLQEIGATAENIPTRGERKEKKSWTRKA
jgi:hypothetical protein